MSEIKRVGIVGAGVMGRGVAQAVAQSNMDAVFIDTSDEILAAARREIGQAVRFQSMMTPALSHHTPESVDGRIATSTDLSSLADVDFLVENISEKVELKRALYPQLDAICPNNHNPVVCALHFEATSDTTHVEPRKLDPLIVRLAFVRL